MIDLTSELADVLRRCLVRIERGDAVLGSGFWVAPRLVLTSAHVAAAGDVVVVWQGHSHGGHVYEAAPPVHVHSDEPWSFPDLALVSVPGAANPECVWLSDQRLAIDTPLLVMGYNQIYGSTPQVSTAIGRYGGPQGIDGSDFLRFVGDEIAVGMSGGPVLDRRTGAVCGVAKGTRDVATNMGGVFVPLTGLCGLSSASRSLLWGQHDRHHASSRWASIRGRHELLTSKYTSSATRAEEEVKLLGLLAEVSIQDTHFALYRSVVGESARWLDSPGPELRDLVHTLNDMLGPPGGLHPLCKFTADLASLVGGAVAEGLVRWTEQVTMRRGEYAAYVQWRSRPGTVSEAEDPMALIVQIKPGSLDPSRYMVTMWVSRSGGNSVKVHCDDNALRSIEDVLTLVSAKMRPLLKQLHGRAMVEFVIPPELFHEEFENLTIGRHSRLGRTNPVVLRDLERLDSEETWHAWQTRWRRRRAGDSVVEWLDCDDKYSPDELDGRLRMTLDVATLGLSRRPDGALRELLDVALYAGVPVAVWRRDACSQQCDRTGSRHCAGSRFREEFTRELQENPDVSLPELVRALRSAVAAGESPECRNVVLLWDDPDRIPEPDAPLAEPVASPPRD